MSLHTSPVLLSLNAISHHKAQHAILQQINLEVQTGEVVVILGPSGCGKSTLLRCINGLEPLSAGSLTFAGQQLHAGSEWTELRRSIGMVFQHYQLFPHLNVLENLCLAPVVAKGEARDIVSTRALQLLGKVGLADKAQALPRQLSGGQQQRVAIARALCMQPQLMLFDEITAALDPEMVLEVLQVLRDLADDGMTMLLVTHELSFAEAIADRIIFMDAGRIVESAPPAQFFHQPQTARAQQFLSHFQQLQQMKRKTK
ncbi:amino acid ABC transporter ATP-binding protein [Rheinheimera texasensis]|uniref:amino acid ABC transporter ATP-binding protein n=1 Tax=Rheinheimera texasensis TaxID=306205 RepID=UPI0032B1116D